VDVVHGKYLDMSAWQIVCEGCQRITTVSYPNKKCHYCTEKGRPMTEKQTIEYESGTGVPWIFGGLVLVVVMVAAVGVLPAVFNPAINDIRQRQQEVDRMQKEVDDLQEEWKQLKRENDKLRKQIEEFKQ